MNKFERRIIDISYKYHLSHLSSCLNAVNIIDGIYSTKKKDEPFILSNGHAGLALYVVLEKHEGKNAEELWKKHGTHPNRDLKDGIWCSTGSLGMGITVAVGMALADRNKDVYVMISDGECAEGSLWEALRIANDQKLERLKIACIANGYSALGKVDVDLLDLRLSYFYPAMVVKRNMFKYPPYLQGIDGHYKVLSEKEYKEVINEYTKNN